MAYKLTHSAKMKPGFFFIIFLIVFSLGVSAQHYPPAHGGNSVDSASKTVSQYDIVDLYRQIAGKPSRAAFDSSKIKKDKIYLSFIPAIGYTVQTTFTAVATANLSFYLDDKQNSNISTIYASANFSLLKQIVIPVITNIWSKGNNFDFLGDYRYYVYPSITYGLGGHTTLADADPIDYKYIRFYQEAAKEIFPDFLAGIGYNLDYHYDIRETAVETVETDFEKYDGGKIVTTTVSSGLSFNLLYDTRRNSNNPQGGWYGYLSVRPNLTYLGSNNNWQSVYLEFRKYIKFPQNSHNVLAFWNFNWFTFGHAPYLDLPATAWETYANSARGYVQDRFKSPSMLYFESEYRFQILNNGFMGGVVFANAQSVANYPSSSFDAVYPGFGAGLRFKINKFSNTNACIDYGIGLNGSRAFYLNLGEVF